MSDFALNAAATLIRKAADMMIIAAVLSSDGMFLSKNSAVS